MLLRDGSAISNREMARPGQWRRASASTPFNDCVEVGTGHGRVAVRDSKMRSGELLSFSRDDWKIFLYRLREHE